MLLGVVIFAVGVRHENIVPELFEGDDLHLVLAH